jgi:DNA-binding MarR family transcriptional regulator
MKDRQKYRPAAAARTGTVRVKRSQAATATRKLDLGGLNNHLGYFVRRLQVWIFQDFIQSLRTMNVRPAQYSVLLVIEANPGRSQAAIGQTLGIERARLARLLHELERRKWISRRASGNDARSYSLHLTAEGEQALAKIKRLAEQHEARLSDHVGAERRSQLMDLLRDFG